MAFSTKNGFHFKVTIIGDSGVGKSSIVSRLADDSFSLHTSSTIGAAFRSFKRYKDNKLYVFKLWDTAGQERFKSLVPMYLRDSSITLLVFDVTCYETWENVKRHWVSMVDSQVPDSVKILIGNKIDLGNRDVNKDDVLEFAKSYDINYIELSAKSGENLGSLDEALINSARALATEANMGDKNDTVVIERRDEKMERFNKCFGRC